ncbi:PAS domain-containing hybrid sensor histidine kinase/response regulator [Amphiplicatus metriothermophilus]|uniref:histidine kinase n=1 Tax=Amphiplicatus metriothermophilus TaxID=1519374 RepID=A0A239PQ35_9PROT|nr:NahK/ErcS family hybrid sensor histidine kinase/response regulator [Amphiplicatus metriothermophilus]MBB5518444.1 Na+/proline symporter/signal transduction histidine kinase/CheY-like chemotaxis protein [Amphiplicatus metriothermophilus]SNT72394.1 Na+/proline symporter [Amphiplicatus metriothermophilus]
MALTGSWMLIGLSVAYLWLLFLIAYYGDKRADRLGAPLRQPIVYSLALTVYCTSWSLYGTTQQTAATGWIFPPTYVGTIILFIFLLGFLHKLIVVSKRQNIVSVADFISARYGKSRRLAFLATFLAVICVTPYIALQLKAVTESLNLLSGAAEGSPGLPDTALIVAGVLALFSILFGARRSLSTEHNRGLMLAIAFEAVFKLAAFAAVGAFALFSLHDGVGDLVRKAVEEGVFESASPTGRHAFLASIVLGVTSIICLPRLFHVLVVENTSTEDLRAAQKWYVLYLIAMGAFVWPIAAAALLAGGEAAASGYHLLVLPLSAGEYGLAVFAYLGGLSAATSMVIVATVALGVMVGNDLVTPFAIRSKTLTGSGADLSARVLTIRRLSIVFLLALAYGYYRFLGGADQLASIGLMSMALAAQFAPAIIGGLYWKGGHPRGAAAGLVFGAAVWAYTLLAPTLVAAGAGDPRLVVDGPWGIGWLRPTALFGLEGWDPIAHGLFWSLLFNATAYVAGSLSARQDAALARIAGAFVSLESDYAGAPSPPAVSNGRLIAAVGRFIGHAAAAEAFERYFRAAEKTPAPDAPADHETYQFAERLLAGAIGAASARVVLQTAAGGRAMDVRDVVTIANETARVFRFNRDLLQASLDNLSVGISVVDKNLRLVAWNSAYERLFSYPEDFLYEGRHVRDLLAYNAARGEFGETDPDGEIEKRLRHLRAATPYSFQRARRDGTVIEIRGNPMPGGGFVTSYTDVTDFVSAENALRDLNETLERRVAERTEALTRLNEALVQAKAEAERANRSKTKFFAAVSHDVLQPLNAARLFAGALAQQNRDRALDPTIANLDSALNAVQDLLSEVLDLSRLDAGGLEPAVQTVSLGRLLRDLAAEFAPVAQKKGLALRAHDTSLLVRSDPRYLRRIVQNLLANAIRYTARGRVAIGVRRAGDRVRIEVWDTGPGIAAEHLNEIFQEFRRIPSAAGGGERGLGIGLAIVDRIARLLDHPVGVRSAPGRGSVFSVTVPLCGREKAQAAPRPAGAAAGPLAGLAALCVDNDSAILEGMRQLLSGWGCEVAAARSGAEGIVAADRLGRPPDILLIDYHLDGEETGFDALALLRARFGEDAPCIVISADSTDMVKRRAEAAGCRFLAKPARPAALRALIAGMVASRALREPAE